MCDKIRLKKKAKKEKIDLSVLIVGVGFFHLINMTSCTFI